MKNLTENQIYIIQDALRFAREKLKTVYQEKHIDEELSSIVKKLELQLKDLEHHR